jgi:hypothetical protein
VTQQEVQEAAITVVTRKFPELESLAQTKIALIDSWEHLSQVILGLTYLDTREDVEQFLHRLSEDQFEKQRRRRRGYRVSMFDPTFLLYEWMSVKAFAEGYSQSLQQRIQEGTLEIQQAIQLSVEQGIELGIQRGAQALQAAAIDVVECKFDELLPLAVRVVTTVDNLQDLQQQILDLSALSSEDEAEQFFLSLLANPLYEDLLEKGVQEVIQATRTAAIAAVVKRFPYSLEFPRDRKTTVGDSQHSQQSIRDLRYLPDPEEVEKLLLSLLEEPRYAELPEDDVQKLAQAAQEEARDCVESLQKKFQEDGSEVKKIIQEAVRQGDELGAPLGAQILRQAASALVALRFPKLESLAQKKISDTNDMGLLRELICDLSTISDQAEAEERLLSK